MMLGRFQFRWLWALAMHVSWLQSAATVLQVIPGAKTQTRAGNGANPSLHSLQSECAHLPEINGQGKDEKKKKKPSVEHYVLATFQTDDLLRRATVTNHQPCSNLLCVLLVNAVCRVKLLFPKKASSPHSPPFPPPTAVCEQRSFPDFPPLKSQQRKMCARVGFVKRSVPASSAQLLLNKEMVP